MSVKSNEGLFITAVKGGDYISVNIFKPGIGQQCGCNCPECGAPVCSNVTAKSTDQLKIKYTNHFSHIDKNTQCSGGYKETELHLFAKQVIENNNSFKVPAKQYHYPDTLHYINVVLEKAFPVEEYKQYRPDIILTNDIGEKIVVEIVVTNPLSLVKSQIYKESGVKCLTIDLSDYRKKEIDLFKQEIEEKILEIPYNKKWIWPVLLQDIDEDSKPIINQNPSNNQGCLLIFLVLCLTFLIYLF